MTDSENGTEKVENNETSTELEDEWMIRRCAIYDEEYSDCTSFRARFHQYFVHGKTIDCGQWKRDSGNCYKWTEYKDLKAGKELVESEKCRRRERLRPHYQNTIWERRKTPPENWNKPLPDHIQKEYEQTYLYIKSRELKGEIEPSFDANIKYCNIL